VTPDTRYAERDGCRLVYDVRGAGPDALFIQGVGVHGDGWLPQTEALAGRFRCLSFDNRGVGRSRPPDGRLTVEQMAGDALAILDAEGIDRAHVAGHSMGGLIALELALTHPERVRSLALVCTSAAGADLVQLSWWKISVGIRSKLGPKRLRRRAFLELVMPEKARREADPDAVARRLEPIFGYDLASQPAFALKQVAAMRGYDAGPRLERLAGKPTLVVSGSLDRMAPPRAGRALAAGIAGSQYVEIDDEAHGLTVFAADRVTGLLSVHFEGADAADARSDTV
jgi:pimeloyl-ACP methyl ester carboxylesterase